MRKSLWIVLAVMVVAVSAPNAQADSFTAAFTCTIGTCTSPLPTASDVTFPVTTTWEITFAGVTFALDRNNITSPASASWGVGDPLTIGFTPGTFVIFGPAGDAINTIGQPALATLDEGGTVTFTPVTAPEPSLVALLLLGVGFVFVLRKRNPRGQQLAT